MYQKALMSQCLGLCTAKLKPPADGLKKPAWKPVLMYVCVNWL